MRRRAFLDQTVIALSRAFVCVRLNAWQDELNIKRMVTLQGAHQNSSLALLAPDAPGLSVDGFPGPKACAWGPLDFNGGDRDAPWEKVGEALDGLPDAMRKLAKRYPRRPKADATRPVLPVFPDLEQVLNMAACDSVSVVVEVAEGDDVGRLDERLLTVLPEPAVVGRSMLVRLTPDAWRREVEAARIVGDLALEGPGVAVLAPDAFGLTGRVLAVAPGVPGVGELRHAWLEGLARFGEVFHKEDRSTHIIEGRLAGVRWKEADPAGWRALLEDGEGGASCDTDAP